MSVIVALTALAPAVIAAPGDLDTTFGDSGRVLFDPLPGLDGSVSVHGMAEQTDGKLVVVGTADASGSRVLVLVRFDPNGPIDTTFGNAGVVDSSHLQGSPHRIPNFPASSVSRSTLVKYRKMPVRSRSGCGGPAGMA